MPKDKPVLGLDDVLLLLTHLEARDTYIFPMEDQRYALATILLLSIFIRAQLIELMDVMKHNAPHKYPWEHPDTPNLSEEEPTIDPVCQRNTQSTLATQSYSK
jgi:hypothetical protein